MINIDVLVVGSGISGITAARFLAEKGKQVLLVEKNNVIGGACRDEFSKEGINVHLYGPHIFRTSNKQVFDFITRFSKLNHYQHKVSSYVLGVYCDFPINLNTLKMLYDDKKAKEICEKISQNKAIGKNFEEVIKSKIGDELYSLFYFNYSKKQWLMEPNSLIPELASIIPIRKSIDARYYSENYQGLPDKGYFSMFNNMLNHPNIKVLLNTNYKEIQNDISYNTLIYTGRLDEFFDKIHGELEYHSVRFEYERIYKKTLPTTVVNYPNDYDYIRQTDYTGFMEYPFDVHIIGTEYPQKEGVPLYAVPDFNNTKVRTKYEKLVRELPDNIKLVGRLATYRNLSMGQSVFESLKVCEKVK